jgi:hypothetical protein
MWATKWHAFWASARTSADIWGTPFSFDSPKVTHKVIFQGRPQYKSCFYLSDQKNDIQFRRPQECPWTSQGRPFSLTAQKWHSKWFFRGVPNIKVVSIWVTNKMTWILGIHKDVREHLRDALSFWQSKSDTQSDFSGASPIQKLFLFEWPKKWHTFQASARMSLDIWGTPFFFDSPKVAEKMIFQIHLQYKTYCILWDLQIGMHFRWTHGHPRTLSN